MAPAMVGMLVLAAIALIAAWRSGRRPIAWALNLAVAATLWATLWPPSITRPAATLVVATAGAGADAWRAHAAAGPAVALPEAPALPGAQPVPDLATALRRHPQVGRVRVVGDGLPARDLEALGGRGLEFDPPPPRPGPVALHAPSHVTVAVPWRLRGRILGVPGARVELLDPARRVVAATAVDADGAFALVATAPIAGRIDYVLVLRDGNGRERERTRLPLRVAAGRGLRLWLLSGGPDPEQKYLRRWAEDGGYQVRARAALGGGLAMGDALPLDAKALREADVLVLDQRAWRGLGASAREQLRQAVAEGLGLVLRLQEAPGASDRAVLRSFGFLASSAAPAKDVRLTGARPPFAGEEPVPLTRAPAQAEADDAVVLLRDAQGQPLARWRALGRGRVASAWLGDSYRLALSGHSQLHARLWARALAVVARADAGLGPRIGDTPVFAQQRARVCGLDASARAVDPQGVAVALLPDADGCAGWWPARAGWHRLQSGDGFSDWPVHAEDALPALRAHARREATLARRSAGDAATTGAVAAPGPRWPWFLAWLLASALAWWQERRRRVAKDEPSAAAR